MSNQQDDYKNNKNNQMEIAQNNLPGLAEVDEHINNGMGGLPPPAPGPGGMGGMGGLPPLVYGDGGPGDGGPGGGIGLKNKTIILATHAVSYLKYANNIIVMEQGEIKLKGKLNDLINANKILY